MIYIDVYIIILCVCMCVYMYLSCCVLCVVCVGVCVYKFVCSLSIGHYSHTLSEFVSFFPYTGVRVILHFLRLWNCGVFDK